MPVPAPAPAPAPAADADDDEQWDTDADHVAEPDSKGNRGIAGTNPFTQNEEQQLLAKGSLQPETQSKAAAEVEAERERVRQERAVKAEAEALAKAEAALRARCSIFEYHQGRAAAWTTRSRPPRSRGASSAAHAEHVLTSKCCVG